MFLFPLYLEYYLKADIQKIISSWPEGIPVDVTSKLLPLKSGLSLGVWLHVYLQNTVTRTIRNKPEAEKFSKKKLLQLTTHLENTIMNLSSTMGRSVWSDYYSTTISGNEYLQNKEVIFREIIEGIEVKSALDLGCNDGYFSRILAAKGISVIATDNDSRTISKLYDEVKSSGDKNILPLIMDVANPSPAIGFRNRERASFHERMKTELVVALALVHHLVIGKNISLPLLAAYFSDISSKLIIEWIPKTDEKVQQMLASRKDIFDDFTIENFEKHFVRYFSIIKKHDVPGSGRTIYLMEKG
jgi:ribosomal protein L11 methylase PrmA